MAMAGPSADPDLDGLRAEVLAAARRYAQAAWEAERPFIPGETMVPVSGKVLGAPELHALVEPRSTAGSPRGASRRPSAPGSPR
jgi:hypothetical protein